MGQREIFSKNCHLVFLLAALFFLFSQAYADLAITPAEDYFCSGTEGCPFSPSQKIYTLSNQSEVAITWGVSESVNWIECSPEWGPLDPNESVEVSVSITSAADILTVGEYIEDVVFTDITNGVDETRQVILSVGSVSSGPVAWWKLDGDATDSSGNGHDGTAHGDPNWITGGEIDGAIELDGAGDYLSVPSHNDLHPDFPFSISLWINADNPTSHSTIVTVSPPGDDTYTGFSVRLLETIIVTYGNGGSPSPASRHSKFAATSLQPEQWYHVAAVVRGYMDIDLFIDGISEGDYDEGTATTIAYANSDLSIGSRDGSNNFFDGMLDDVRFYNRALTDAEVAELAGIGPLVVSPAGSLDASGEPGGPFSPAYKDYTLKNLSEELLFWGIDTLPDWMDVDSSFGSLDPNESTTVRVFLTEQADLLEEGLFTTAVTINNLSTVQDPIVRDVNLDIQIIRGIWASPESFNVTLTEGSQQQDILTVGNDGTETLNFSLRTRTVVQSTSASISNEVTFLSLDTPQKMIFDVQQSLSREHKPGQVLVRFAQDSEIQYLSYEAQQNSILNVLPDATIIRQFGTVPGLCLIQLAEDTTVEEALNSLNGIDNVLYAQPNYRVYADSVFPNDARFDDLWGLHNTGQTGGLNDADIDVPEAWDISTGSDSIIVAVIDTGVDYNHEDLAGNMWVNQLEYTGSPGVDDDGNGYVDDIYGYDFDHGDGDPMDDHYHGTHCAGTIGAVGNNGIGIVGVCWDVQIMAIKFLDSGGGGWTDDAIDSVEYATLMGADIMSNSWGGGSYSQGLKDAIDAAGAAGIAFVAAAGNDSVNNDTYPHYPSSYTSDNVIAVMATDDDDNRSGFSSWGPTSVDIGAPGTSILSCEPGNRYQYLNGTSMATPHVAGAYALLKSTNPALSISEIKDILYNSVDSIPALAGKCTSEGRLNMNAAILETKVPWIELDIEQGLLNPDQSVDVTVTFSATDLTPGIYHAEILVLSDDPAHPVLTIPVELTVLPDPLEVTPDITFDPNGLEGGPFEPNSIVYTVSNTGASSLEWSIDWQADWLTIDQMTGTLDPTENIDILVSVNANAETLLPGLYEDSIVFNNLTLGSIQKRDARLTVRPPDKFTEQFESQTIDIQNTAITFRPDGSVSYYAACVEKEAISSFPVDPNGGIFVSIGDDDYSEVIFGNGKQLNYYGVVYDRIYIGSNGYLTFGQGDAEFEPILDYHFGLPRISALFTDLTPTDNQSISYIQMDDRFVVTYFNIPVFGDKTAINSFQVELFFADGALRISYLNIDASSAIAGLSDGNGLPGFFEESDLSSYLNCCDCGDTDGDGVVGLSDLSQFGLVWLESSCVDSDWCSWADINRSGQVDLLDWSLMSENWQKTDYAWSESEFLLELNGKAWSEPELLPELNDGLGNNALLPCISLDELTMYFTRHNPSLGMYSIVESTRLEPSSPFTSERVLTELNVVTTDGGCTSPWISSDGLRLYCREDISDIENRIKMAQRDSVGDPWTPVKTFDELHESGYRGAIMSLTEDELTIVWHSGNRPGTGSIDLWIATRSSMEEAFGNIRELTELNTVEGDTAPRISPDGLTIYFGSQYRDGSTTADLYKATRPSLAELFTNVERIEFPGHETRWEANPFITPDGSTLFFDDGSGIWVTTFEPDSEQYPVRNAFLSSDGLTLYGCRVYQDTQRIVEFNRDLQDLPFEEIREYDELDFANGPWVSLDGLRLYYHDINGTLYAERSNQTEVWTPIRAMTEIVGSAPTLTDDELLIFYHSSASGSVSGSDRTLWIASRASIHDPFSNQRPLDELNCPNRQYAPSVLADGLTIYFASNRDDVNNYSIYKATRQSRAELFSQIQKVHDGVGTITQTPFVTEDETRLFYVDRLEAIQQEGTFLTEWVPNSEECLPR